MDYKTKLAEIMTKRDPARAEREERDLCDLEEIADYIADESYVVLQFPDADASLPGHVVVRRPSGVLMERFRHTMWRDAAQRGATEAKSAAGAQLAAACLKWPTPERYKALCEAFSGAADKVAAALIEASQASAQELGKA